MSRRREAPDTVGGRAAAVGLRPGHHGVGVGERGLLLGEALRAEHPAGDLAAVRRATARSSEARPRSRGEFAAAEAVLGGARAPILAQRGQVEVLLSFAGLERRDLGRVEAVLPPRASSLDRPALRRVENSRITARGTLRELGHALAWLSHSTPSVRVSSARSCAW